MVEIHAKGIAKEQRGKENEKYKMRIDATPDLHRIYKGIITFSPYTYSIDDTNEEQNYCVLNLLQNPSDVFIRSLGSCESQIRNRIALDWTGLYWTELDWTGLDWTGLE